MTPYALLYKQGHVPSIAIYNEGILTFYESVELLTPLLVIFYDFGIHIFRHHVYASDSCGATTHDHNVLHIDIMFFTHYLPDIRNIVFCCHEIGEVI